MSSDDNHAAALTDTLGRPLNDLRISLTDKCNFNCTYCMPKLLDRKYEFMRNSEIMTADEIIRLVRIFAGQGVTKCRVNGGGGLFWHSGHRQH
jgi:GTP 3',8-cyclase